MRTIFVAAAIALGAAAMPAAASETSTAQTFAGSAALDRLDVDFVRHNREHRLWEVRRTQEMQQRRGYRDRGYGYERRGPPPHARAYGRRDRDRYNNRW
jgi:hypothetical protein